MYCQYQLTKNTKSATPALGEWWMRPFTRLIKCKWCGMAKVKSPISTQIEELQ